MANRLLFQVVIILMILTNSTTLKAISSIAPTENSLKENAIVHTDIAEYNTRRYIDTDGSTMVIGAYESSTQQGAAFVYEKEDGEWIQKAVLTSTDNTIADHTHFGYAVAIKGDVIVIGAPLADEAYIFEKPETGWEDMTETLKISSPLPKGSYYGFSLAMNENNIAVSAYRYSNYRGRILLYQKDTDELWSQVTFTTTTLLSVQPRTNEYLGYELRMDDDALVSGALGYNSWQGRLYVYNLPDGKYLENNITPDATLTVEDGGDYQVGIHVAIDKNVILATDYGDDQKGTIHVFRKEEGKEWEDSFEAFSITDDALIEKDYFGADLDVDNNEIIIGASQGKNEGLGKVYHYILSSTNAELINVYETDKVNKDDHFAASVHFTDEDILVSTMYNKEYPFFSFSRAETTHSSIDQYDTRRYIDTDGSTMVIGAYESNKHHGAAFVYEKEEGEWVQKAVLTSTDNTIADYTHFGYAVAIKGDVIVIGAPLADEAYIFEKPETGWEDMTETVKISSPLPKGSYYGFSLAMNENNIAVSAYRYSNYQGRILLYQKDTDELWSQVTFTTTTLLSVQPRTNEYLGYELRMDEDALVSGALGYNSWQGRLYVYNLPDGKYLENNITPDATLAVKDGGDYQVGIHVAIDKNVILATDYGDDQKGTIHVFRKEEGKEWEDSFEAFSITDDALIEKDYYGADLDVDNNEIIIGASQGKNEGLGKVYHYILSSTNAELINVYETDQVNKDDHFAASVHFTDEDILVSTMYNKEYPFFSFSRRKDVTNLEVHVNTQKPFLLSSHPKYGISDKIEFGHLNTKTYSYKLIDINGGIMKEGLLPESGIIQLDQKLRGIKIIQLIEKDKVYIYKLLR